MSCRYLRIPALITLAMSVLVAASAAVADDAVCKEFTKKTQRIERLGGPQAFSKTPVKSPGELVEQLEAHRSELETLMRDRGLGHLTDDLIKAAGDSRRLSERPLERGEVFEWMAWRKRSGATTTGPLCFAAKKSYEAYEILVREEKSTSASKATCSLKATGKWDDEKISVDASGSSRGVEVTMSGPGGNQTIISGGSTTWSGSPSGPGTYKFTARAQVPGGSTATTTHTFVVPKICVNLAYKGASTSEQTGSADSCTETASVDVVRRLPECTISVPAEVLRKELFSVNVTGSNYDSATVKIKDAATGQYVSMQDENKQDVSELTQFPTTIMSRRTGEYVLEGSASNAHASADCTSARFTVTKPLVSGWTLRGFLLTIATDDDEVFRSVFRSDGVNERSGLRLDGGEGLGLGLEYRFNDRVGLEASLLWANLDSSFILDLDNEWERDADDASFLAITFGPNFHLTPNSKADFYIGPFVGFADIGNSTFGTLGETHNRDFGDDFLIGLQLGLDIPFGDSSWGLHLGGRYIDLTVGDDADELDVNPILGELGFFKNF